MNMTITPTEFTASQVRLHMKKQGKTQADLSDVLGVSQQSVSKRLSGITPLDINELHTIADYLQIDLADLIGRKSA